MTLKQLIRLRKITPYAVAKSVGVTPSTLYRILNGTRGSSVKLAYAIGEHLKAGVEIHGSAFRYIPRIEK